MSLSNEVQSWLDRWWPLLIILFGFVFVLILAKFHPAA